jgi:tetratricopeptide (TPR) repeat protein
MFNAFGALGDMDSARFYLNRLQARAPHTPATLVQAIQFAAHAGDDSTALAAAAELERARSPITVEMGRRAAAVLLLRGGRIREAQRLNALVLESERQRGATGGDRNALFFQALNRATFFGDSAGAVALLDSALKVDPWERSAPRDRDYLLYGMAASASHRPDVMGRALDQLRRDDPGQPLPFGGPALLLLEGQALAIQGKYADAIAAFRRGDVGLSLNPTAIIATTFDQAGQKDSAIVYYERIVSKAMTSMWTSTDARYGQHARRRLGELYEERGEFDKAYDMYASFVRTWKNADPELQPAVATIRVRMNRLDARRAR